MRTVMFINVPLHTLTCQALDVYGRDWTSLLRPVHDRAFNSGSRWVVRYHLSASRDQRFLCSLFAVLKCLSGGRTRRSRPAHFLATALRDPFLFRCNIRIESRLFHAVFPSFRLLIALPFLTASPFELAPQARKDRSNGVALPSRFSGPGIRPILCRNEALRGLSPAFTGLPN